MRFHVVDEIPYERELVFSTHRDHLLDLVPYMDNIDRIEIPIRDEDGDCVRFENLWHGKSSDIPAMVRPFIKPETLRWIDRATWDQGAWKVDWEIELLALPGAITARGTNRFRDEFGETVIEMNGEFALHPDKIPGVPLFAAKRAAPAVERFVVGLLEPNLRDGNRAVQRYIEDNLL